MKKKFFILFVLTLVFSSCSKVDDNAVYSDDTTIDKWVKANKASFDNIKLEEISSYYGEKQRAIYRYISDDNKKAIWLEKFFILKNNCKVNEKKTLEDFYGFVEKIDFSKSFSQVELNYLNEVVKKGRTELNWTDEFIGITFCSFEFVNGNSNYNIFKTSDVNEMMMVEDQSSGGEKNNCNCKWGGMFACGSMECVKNNCQDDGKKGCGFLLLESCTGRCQM